MRRVLAIVLGLALASPSATAEPIEVVATFSILGDMVETVGGDRVRVRTLVGPDGDAHVYQPSPADAQAVAQADLIVANGLGLEGWMDRLTAATETDAALVELGTRLVASAAVAATRDPDATDAPSLPPLDPAASPAERFARYWQEAAHRNGPDPHLWQNLSYARGYVTMIADALTAIDPAGAQHYATRATAYRQAMSDLERKLVARLAAVEADELTVVVPHDAFRHFEAAYGVRFVASSSGGVHGEASGRDIARVIRTVKQTGATAVFLENVSDPRLARQIADDTGAAIGGTLYSDALSAPDGPAPTYLDMMRYNIDTLLRALAR